LRTTQNFIEHWLFPEVPKGHSSSTKWLDWVPAGSVEH